MTRRALTTGDSELAELARRADMADALLELRELARTGDLAEAYRSAATQRQRLLRSAAYAVVWPVVYQRLTRTLERRRGHYACAVSVNRLADDCFDRFEDDVEAVIDDLFRNARTPTHNLEGWISVRLVPATVDANRRRRGERGALQRPRLPAWLARELGDDRWLTTLAMEILVWVGVPAAAGGGLWPLDAWADLRAALPGERHDRNRVQNDIQLVLAAMRRNPDWYDSYVERPLGRKPAPLAPEPPTDSDSAPLQLTEPHEADDARLLELATLAIQAIEQRLQKGDDPRSAVIEVLRIAFGSTSEPYLDQLPDVSIDAVLSNPATLDHIVTDVIKVLDQRADQRLRDRETVRRAPRPTGLTDAELRVARLVAEGRTNREVAEQLHLSPHTVDSHLRHVFAKVGIKRRAELTRQIIGLDKD
ncbi:MAG TPA: LuxR C-terminal-related transcriptional regulator [Rugosimonospora sp.]|nr:LuxR C-terminal-related transcriptional regulator [Rugosimonospora sp.]